MTIYRPETQRQTQIRYWLTLIFSGLLSACSAPPTKAPAPTALDSDVVAMPSLGNAVSRQSVAGVKPMTASELVACAQRIIKAKEDSVALQKENVKLAAEKTELYEQTQALDELRGRIQADSIKAVNDFNRRIQINHDDIKTYNAAVNAYNDKANALNLLNGKYNTECGNRSYRQSDYANLKPDLKAAIDSKSEFSDIPLIEDSNAVSAPARNSGQFHIPARSTR